MTKLVGGGGRNHNIDCSVSTLPATSENYKNLQDRTDSALKILFFPFYRTVHILVPVCAFPVVSLLCGRLDEEGVGGKGVKVDQGGLLSPAAV